MEATSDTVKQHDQYRGNRQASHRVEQHPVNQDGPAHHGEVQLAHGEDTYGHDDADEDVQDARQVREANPQPRELDKPTTSQTRTTTTNNGPKRGKKRNACKCEAKAGRDGGTAGDPPRSPLAITRCCQSTLLGAALVKTATSRHKCDERRPPPPRRAVGKPHEPNGDGRGQGHKSHFPQAETPVGDKPG